MYSRGSGRSCAVRGCTNNQRKLNLWLQEQCFEHAPRSKRECGCERRYSFYCLPREEESRRMWLKNLNLKKPPQNLFVCSFHFVEKKPTEEHPYPTLFLGYDKPPEKRRRVLRTSDSTFTRKTAVFPVQTLLMTVAAPEEWSSGVDQQDPEELNIKEEQEEPWLSLEGEQRHGEEEETDATRLTFTALPMKCETEEEKPLLSQLHLCQMENRDVPTADQMKVEADVEDCGVAETSRNPDPNTHGDASSSSETEMSEDYDVDEDGDNPDYEPETKVRDEDWKKKMAPELGINTVKGCVSCSECGKQFVQKGSLQRHMAWHSRAKESVGVKNKLESCWEVQSKEKTLSFDECGEIFKKDSNKHMEIHTGQKPFACHVCGHTFSRKTSLHEHMRIHTGEKPFACDVCGHRFNRKSDLNKHMRIHTGEKPFVCDVCGHRCSRKTDLNTHMRIHTGEKPFACDTCGHTFSCNTHLSTHMRIHTGEKPFACNTCGNKFSCKTDLNKHFRIHTGEKPFVCNVCGLRFSHKNDLKKHTRIHTGEKPFVCDTCGHTFNRKTHLKTHRRIHTGEKPFACHTCGHRFSCKRNLNTHFRIHTGLKPFACDICEYRCIQKIHLDTHMRIHTGQNHFACDVCGLGFSQRRSLNMHVRVHIKEGPICKD